MRRSLVAGLSLCLCVLGSAGCGGSRDRRSLVELIPADAFVVLTVNWRVVRDDGDLQTLVKGAELKKVLSELGMKEEMVADLAVFGEGPGGADGSTGMLLRGSFDAREVAASAKGRGWREESYNGRRVYQSPTDGTRLAALGSGALACGTKRGVEGVIRAASDVKSSFASTAAYRRLSRLSDTSESPVSMLIAVPQQFQDAADAALQVSSVVMDFAGVGALGQLMSKIGYSRAIGCSIRRKGDLFPVKLVAVMKDEEAAALVSGGLTLLKGIGVLVGQPAAQSPEQAEAIQNFRNMSVSRDGDVLSIGLLMSRRNLFPN